MEYFNSLNGLYHYLICPQDDCFIPDTLEKLDYHEYLYRLLKEKGYRRIIFFEYKESTHQYKILTFDKFSAASFEKRNLFENIDIDDEEALEAAYRSMETPNNFGGKRMKVSEPETKVPEEKYGRRMSANNVDGALLVKTINERIIPAIKSNKIKTAIVMPVTVLITIVRDGGSVDENILQTFNKVFANQNFNHIVLFTMQERGDICQLSRFANMLKGFNSVTTSNPEEYIKNVIKVLKASNNLVEVSQIGLDEIINLLLRKKFIDMDERFSNIKVGQIEKLAQTIYDQCYEGGKRIFQNLPSVKDPKVARQFNFMKFLEGSLSNTKFVDELILHAKKNPNHKIKSNIENHGLELERFTGIRKGLSEMDIEEAFSNIIGLEAVKQKVREQHSILIALQKRNKMGNVANITQTLNFVFTGNPGTGKTSIARVIAEMFRDMGLLKKGQLIEVSRKDLVAGYVGQTALKVEEIFNRALGGVLFIDEVYALSKGGDNDFGKEAIDTLLKLIEDHAGELVVILAGYEKEMLDFMDANSGLESRFPKELRVHFSDYSADELYKIGKSMLKKQGFEFEEGASEIFETSIRKLKSTATQESGNGRMVRNYVDEIVRRQSVRIASNDVPDSEINYIIKEDIEDKARLNKNFSLEKEFDKIIGLQSVKEKIEEQYGVLVAEEKRRKAGIDIEFKQYLNFVFTGNPGTGKTTIARVVARMFKEMGLLSKGQLIEVSRKDLVAEYVGQSAPKADKVFRSALGGVLFIDEAYSLTQGTENDFGEEVIDTLIKFIEDNSGDLVVILAGYEDRMMDFMGTNDGLESRFPESLRIHFPDYSEEELLQISKVMIENNGFVLADEAMDSFKNVISRLKQTASADSGNGRMVRNYIEELIRKQSLRIAKEDVEASRVNVIEKADIEGKSRFNKDYDLDLEFSTIIGLDSVKEKVKEQYSILVTEEKRREAGVKTDVKQSLNFIFSGNPGTGKTKMARVVAKMLKDMGWLKRGQLIETNRQGLVAQTVGGTAPKVERVFKSALGGVLFIDEVYTLSRDGSSSVGQEAIDTLLKLIEDHAGELVVILAGYEKEMIDFLESNSGLESRFPKNLRINFPDYSAKELSAICRGMIKDRGLRLADDAEHILDNEIEKLKRTASADSGNGRMVRNFVEEIIRKQSLRIAESDVKPEELDLIITEDLGSSPKANHSFDLEKELAGVIGLSKVKEYIKSLEDKLHVEEEKRKLNLPVDDTQTLHMIFKGNPGTGKTMMARIIANALYKVGVIKTNKLVETDRAGLVGEHVGETAQKTTKVVKSAFDGVLFIDEAYSLSRSGGNDFGQEAIDTLVKLMDDNRSRLVVVLAGYENDMDEFIKSNEGLKSRFRNIISFPDYTPQELLQIAKNTYDEKGYTISEETEKILLTIFESAVKIPGFGNGRFVRNLYEKSLENQATRLREMSNLEREDYLTILPEDISKDVPLNKKEEKHYSKVSREKFEGLNVLFDVNEAIRNKGSLAKATDNAILFVKTDKGAGTAFLISPEGYALTCNHVIEGANEINARLRIPGRFGGDDSFHKCEVINTRKDLDIALIKLEGNNFPYLPIASEDREIEKGEDFILSGYPFGERTAKDITLFSGSVASSERQQDEKGITRYNINCEAKSGNSGAPIISFKDGCVIGLLLGSITEKSGQLVEEINYMRPIKYFWEEFLN